MPKLATWVREKDEKWFGPFFAKHPEIEICNARKADVPVTDADGLKLFMEIIDIVASTTPKSIGLDLANVVLTPQAVPAS